MNVFFFPDGNKFGQKILEKMGWAPGKGLGANEQGMKNVIKVNYKSDTKGKTLFLLIFLILHRKTFQKITI